MAGYSDTPLVQKLGYKQNFAVFIHNAPDKYFEYLGVLPENIRIHEQLERDLDLVHFFTDSLLELENFLPKLAEAIKKGGSIWISWPKKSSGVKTDLDENQIRELALSLGLVDIKVAAIDEIWSGLKLVWRKVQVPSIRKQAST